MPVPIPWLEPVTSATFPSIVPIGSPLGSARLARTVHEQAAVLRLDRTIAVESLPALLPDDGDSAARLLETIGSLLGTVARESAVAQRFQHLARVVSFG